MIVQDTMDVFICLKLITVDGSEVGAQPQYYSQDTNQTVSLLLLHSIIEQNLNHLRSVPLRW